MLADSSFEHGQRDLPALGAGHAAEDDEAGVLLAEGDKAAGDGMGVEGAVAGDDGDAAPVL